MTATVTADQVERVARAIHAAQRKSAWGHGGKADPWHLLTDRQRGEARSLARAAIRAVRKEVGRG